MQDGGARVLAPRQHQRLRLAWVDAPALATAKGKRAHDFVRDRMARAPFVVVKTSRVDLHGRYVGHVFYATREMDPDAVFARGRYLNQELLDAGMAVPHLVPGQ
jgi:endonuclease YncB( thermonuclease family)